MAWLTPPITSQVILQVEVRPYEKISRYVRYDILGCPPSQQ